MQSFWLKALWFQMFKITLSYDKLLFMMTSCVFTVNKIILSLFPFVVGFILGLSRLWKFVSALLHINTILFDYFISRFFFSNLVYFVFALFPHFFGKTVGCLLYRLEWCFFIQSDFELASGNNDIDIAFFLPGVINI